MSNSYENSFSGKLYIAAKGGFTTPPVYATNTGFTIAESAASAGSAGAVSELMMQGDLVIAGKPKGKSSNGNLTSCVISEETTGKATVAIDAALYDSYVAKYQGVECELRCVDTDTMQLVSDIDIKPHFAQTTKIGEMQMAELTFDFIQAANISVAKKRHRLVKMTE